VQAITTLFCRPSAERLGDELADLAAAFADQRDHVHLAGLAAGDLAPSASTCRRPNRRRCRCAGPCRASACRRSRRRRSRPARGSARAAAATAPRRSTAASAPTIGGPPSSGRPSASTTRPSRPAPTGTASGRWSLCTLSHGATRCASPSAITTASSPSKPTTSAGKRQLAAVGVDRAGVADRRGEPGDVDGDAADRAHAALGARPVERARGGDGAGERRGQGHERLAADFGTDAFEHFARVVEQAAGTGLGAHAAARHRLVGDEAGRADLVLQFAHAGELLLHPFEVERVQPHHQVGLAVAAVHAVAQAAHHRRRRVDEPAVEAEPTISRASARPSSTAMPATSSSRCRPAAAPRRRCAPSAAPVRARALAACALGLAFLQVEQARGRPGGGTPPLVRRACRRMPTSGACERNRGGLVMTSHHLLGGAAGLDLALVHQVADHLQDLVLRGQHLGRAASVRGCRAPRAPCRTHAC
jgi:hypothetical protein